MKINELTKGADQYTASMISRKEDAMAKQLLLKWQAAKKAYTDQGKQINLGDFLNSSLPAVKKVVPDFGQNAPVNNSRDEFNLIKQGLKIALQATNYWERQIQKQSNMEKSPYNQPAQPAQPASQPPAPGTAPMAPRTITRTYRNVPYKWDGTQWVGAVTGQPANPTISANLGSP